MNYMFVGKISDYYSFDAEESVQVCWDIAK
jgi:hypothetical protein